MKVLVDTNVVLDVLLNRSPFSAHSKAIFDFAEQKRIIGHISASLSLRWDDLEDSVQFVVGEGLSVDYIVTRNTQDFSSSNIPAVTPEQFVQIIADI
jgi:predicted nucleic acid-binding protein